MQVKYWKETKRERKERLALSKATKTQVIPSKYEKEKKYKRIKVKVKDFI
jgi:hypothetical protein